MRASKVTDPSIVDAVHDMVKRGAHRATIREKLGISPVTLWKIMNALGITRRYRQGTRVSRAKPKPKAIHGRKAWSSSDIAWLVENHKRVSFYDAAVKLGRTMPAVRHMAAQLGIKLRKSSTWSYEHDQFLISKFHTMSVPDIARRLNKSYYAVYDRARRLKLGLVSEQIGKHHLTMRDISLRYGVAEPTVRHWHTRFDMPIERIGAWLVAYDTTITEWMEQGHILRTDRSALGYRDRLMYDRVRAEYYSMDELRAFDLSFVSSMRNYAQTPEKKALLPRSIVVGTRKILHAYFKKTDIWRWVYLYGHLLPDNVKDPDLADVQTAWLTVHVTVYELRQYISDSTQNYWVSKLNFPDGVVKNHAYNRAEVIAWLRAHGKHDIAKRLTRGEILCYDDLIRDRRSRSGVAQ